jgi:hypothetical protein
MGKKSDKRWPGRISATEASRSFSSILDEIEQGATIVVHRRGQDVCVMTSPRTTARKASDGLSILQGRAPALLDDGFASDLLDILAREPIEQRPWDS